FGGCVVDASERCSDWYSSGWSVGYGWCAVSSFVGGSLMIGYLGTPGALVALPYRGGLDTSSDRPVSFTRTLGGKRKAFLGARSRREWGVSVDLAGSKVTSGLVALAQGAGEVAWFPADATAGNLLSPQASGFETVDAGAVDAGFVSLPDGSVARSVAGSGTVRVG